MCCQCNKVRKSILRVYGASFSRYLILLTNANNSVIIENVYVLYNIYFSFIYILINQLAYCNIVRNNYLYR